MRMPGQETPACARNPRSAATSSPQNRHRRPHPVLKVTRSHFVVKNVQQPEDVTVDAARRGDYRWKKGVTHSLCRIARPIFVNLLLCPLMMPVKRATRAPPSVSVCVCPWRKLPAPRIFDPTGSYGCGDVGGRRHGNGARRRDRGAIPCGDRQRHHEHR